MRDIILFIASLAGAAILTALAVLVRPESPLWKALLWGGIAVLIACACVVAIDYFRPGGKAVFLIGMGGGIALFAGCGIAFVFSFPAATNEISEHIANLLVECTPAPLPATVPPDGYIPIVGPFRFGDDMLTISTGGRHGIPGEKWDWPEDWQQKWSTSSLRCSVTNYAATPIFNVKLPITVAFFKIERQPDNPKNFRANTLLGTRTETIEITKIDSGREAPYIFYIQNQSRDAFQIQFSETPTYVALGETERRNAALVQPTGFRRVYHLWSVYDNERIVSDEEKAAAQKSNTPQTQP